MFALDRARFNDDAVLAGALDEAGLVLHFAGINQASEDEQEVGNIALAQRLADALDSHAPIAGIVYANSIHETSDNAYGRGKRSAAEIFEGRMGGAFLDLLLPHIFGEGESHSTITLPARCAARSSMARRRTSIPTGLWSWSMPEKRRKRHSIWG